MSEKHSIDCDLEEMFINVPKNNTELMISRKEYKKDIVIELYDLKEKYYHPEKIIKNKEDKKIKEWLKENDISPFLMSMSDISLFNINFESIFDEKEEIEIEI